MTALNAYQRLEASGLWRASPDDQRREVIVSIGDATLVISDLKDQALTHWSLAAVERANPGARDAIYHPDGDPNETLEINRGEETMINAIEKLRLAVARTRPRPGRLRWASVLASVALVAALAVFWVPGAVLRHTVSVVPDVNRKAIGTALLARIERVAGPACRDRSGMGALRKLGHRIGAQHLTVVRAGVKDSLVLPGGLILLNRALVEDFEEPDVAAGYALAEKARAKQTDPLAALLEASGTMASFRLITTGKLTDATLDAYAEQIVTADRPDLPIQDVLTRFDTLKVRSSPYAYAVDITGETVLPLIEGDPMRNTLPDPLISDGDWIQLQAICGG